MISCSQFFGLFWISLLLLFLPRIYPSKMNHLAHPWTKTARVYLKRYTEHPSFQIGRILEIHDPSLVHYIRNVIRLKPGNQLRIFNEVDGEYLCGVIDSQSSKKGQELKVEVLQQTRPQEQSLTSSRSSIQVNLLFSPIRKENIKFMLEKCTELGVSQFIPLLTKFSQHERLFKLANQELNKDIRSFETVILQSCEQSERLTLPKILPMINVEQFCYEYLKNQDTSTRKPLVFLCQERAVEVPPILSTLQREFSFATSSQSLPTQINVIVGPEGGFHDSEIKLLQPHCQSVSLGKNILRAETASIAAITAIQCFLDGFFQEEKQVLPIKK